MKKFPNKVNFSRSHKLKKFKGMKGVFLNRFTTGLRIKTSHYFSYEHLETARRAITRLVKPKEIKNKKHLALAKNSKQKVKTRASKRQKAKQKKFLAIRSNISLPLTKKPLQVRMGKGKGSVDKWVYAANKSRVLFELSRKKFKLTKIHKLISVTKKKLPVDSQIIYSRNYTRRETRAILK